MKKVMFLMIGVLALGLVFAGCGDIMNVTTPLEKDGEWVGGDAESICDLYECCGDAIYHLKIEPWEKYYDYNGDGELESFMTEYIHEGNTITISVEEEEWDEDGEALIFDWASDYPVTCVVVKGGTDAEVYCYGDDVYGDVGLEAPVNPANGNPYAISNVTFCFNEPPIILEIPETVTVGYEGLPLEPGYSNDFDYNDFVIDIITTPTFSGSTTGDRVLTKIKFEMIPQAHGGANDQQFSLGIFADTFACGGTYNFELFDGDGTSLRTDSGDFDHTSDFEQLIFPSVDDAILPLYNQYENTPSKEMETERTATLTIDFGDGCAFDFLTYDPYAAGNEHGEGLIFNPILYIEKNDQTIDREDVRLVSVPSDWMWPEAGIAIWKVYEDGVTKGDNTIYEGPDFAEGWWTLGHNNCVYGDKIVCGSE